MVDASGKERSSSMNLVLAVIVIAEVCLAICAWRSPECLRWLAAHLLTRADVIDLAGAATKRRLRFWSLELGVGDHGFERESSNVAELENSLARPRIVG
jgi:hypothetical protein